MKRRPGSLLVTLAWAAAVAAQPAAAPSAPTSASPSPPTSASASAGLALGRLDPLELPAQVPTLDARGMAAAYQRGDPEAAQRIASAWHYRNPDKAGVPLLQLAQRVYEVSRSDRAETRGLVTLRYPPGPTPPIDLEALDRFYREAGEALFGQRPPPVQVNVVRALGRGLHGAHFAGQVLVDFQGGDAVARHELSHLLFALHVAAPRVRAEMYWLDEGVAEVVGKRGEDPRLLLRPARLDQAPESLDALFPDQGTWRGNPENPDADYLGAWLAARRLLGDRPYTSGALAQLLGAARMAPDRDFWVRSVHPQGWRDLEAGWLEALRAEYVLRPSALYAATLERPLEAGWPARFFALSLAGEDKLAEALAVVAEAHRPGTPVPVWMMQDAMGLGFAAARRHSDEFDASAALAPLVRSIPEIGLLVPLHLREPEEAERVLEGILGAEPRYPALLYLLLAYWDSPWRPRIEKAWAAAVERNQEDPAWRAAAVLEAAFRGRLDEDAGDFSAVQARIEELAARVPEDAEVPLDLRHAFDESRAAYAIGALKPEAAEAVIRGQLVREGVSCRLLLNLGSTLYTQERFAEALEVYQQGLFLDPSFPGFRLGLGATLLRLGRAEDAATVLGEAGSGGPDAGRMLATRARVAEALGDPEEAERLQALAEAEGIDESLHEVPAEYEVTIYNNLESLLHPDSR